MRKILILDGYRPAPGFPSTTYSAKIDGKWHAIAYVNTPEQKRAALALFKAQMAFLYRVPVGEIEFTVQEYIPDAAKALKKQANEIWERKLYDLIKQAGLPLPVAQYFFASDRKFRFDFAWPDLYIAAEVEGNVWGRPVFGRDGSPMGRGGGRHQVGVGYVNDCRKYNLAAVQGWRVLKFPSDLIRNGECLDTLRAILKKG